MDKGLDILAFLEEAEVLPVIDVRTPSEFKQGHIPFAHNIPLFSDEERKKVGTTYKQAGQKEAVIRGLEFAGPKMKGLAMHAAEIAAKGQLLVHCWRGGMRSSSMAWLFTTVGLESTRLEGGYKSFRNHILDFLDREYSFLVIGGLTGSGKTEVLHALQQNGEQVIDLEKLAHHKGSAFGSLGEDPQQTNEQFENDIFWTLKSMDKRRVIWIEDESRTIGKNTLPGGIYRNIRCSPLLFLDVTKENRIKRLSYEYARFPKEQLVESVEKIRPRLGDLAARKAIENIVNNQYQKTIDTVLHYYDKTYLYGLSKRNQEKVFNLQFGEDITVSDRVDRILEFVRQNIIFV